MPQVTLGHVAVGRLQQFDAALHVTTPMNAKSSENAE